MVVYILIDDKEKKISFKGNTVRDLILQINLNPEEYLASRNKILLTDEDKVNDKDKIELHTVLSGG